MNLSQRISSTINFLKEKTEGFEPEIGIILGTGLGGILKEIDVAFEVPYTVIPNFVKATVESHSGKLVFGTLSGKRVVCMSGRFHYYEGYSMEQVTFPVRVMDGLGIDRLLISNASGGMNPDYKESDLMIIDDHISLFLPESPLVGACLKGDRFPDMSEPYDAEMIQIAKDIAIQKDFERVQQGVYVSVSGPALETKAEYKLLRLVGADAVGMSTVPEALVAIQVGLKVFAISVITDMCIPETLKKAKLENILAAAHKAEPQMTTIIKGILERVG